MPGKGQVIEEEEEDEGLSRLFVLYRDDKKTEVAISVLLELLDSVKL